MGSLEDKLLFQVLVCENSEDSTYSVIAVVNSDGIGDQEEDGCVEQKLQKLACKLASVFYSRMGHSCFL